MSHHPSAPPVQGLTVPATALVTGASRGIGFAIVQALLANAHVGQVIAVSRSVMRSAEFDRLEATQGDRLRRIEADLADDAGLASLTDAMRDVASLHLVVNTAGVLHEDGLAPEKSIEQLTRSSLDRVFALNAFAPVLLARALMPQLCQRQPAVFASLSARVGSIGDNRAGGWYAYRASKAAQNQLLRTFSIEWKRRNPLGTCLLLHPGTVDTGLSGPFRSRVPPDRLFSTAEAASRLLGIISEATPDESGRFIAWDGTEIPW